MPSWRDTNSGHVRSKEVVFDDERLTGTDSAVLSGRLFAPAHIPPGMLHTQGGDSPGYGWSRTGVNTEGATQMAIPSAVQPPALPPTPTLITPDCAAPGCNVTGDQYTMVRCWGCGRWFCPDHIDTEVGVILKRPDRPAVQGLSYYQGSCTPCQQARKRSPRVPH